jgi:hypothetical protein
MRNELNADEFNLCKCASGLDAKSKLEEKMRDLATQNKNTLFSTSR